MTWRLKNGRRFRHAWDVVAVLIERDFKMLYRRSVLGVFWAIANPLLQLVIFSFVFHRVLSLRIPNFASYVFVGVLVWGWFQASLSQSANLITGNRALVRQPGFPLALLPLVTVGVRFIHFLLAIPLLLPVLWKQGLHPSEVWLALPLLVVVQFALTVGFAYPLAALNVRLRDTFHVVTVLLQLAMYLTPVFYSIAHVPESLRIWYNLNPMVHLLGAWRAVLLQGHWPDFRSVMTLAAVALVLVWLGRSFFISQSHRFVEEL